MIDRVTPTIFESFNARALKPSQVAETFVPSTQYRQLTNRNHAIVVGPRGSGKTTLLKMLQQQALEAWEHPEADEFRSRIDYTGIFIATDLSWGAQLDSLGEGRLDPDSHRLLSTAAFTTHVLRSVIIAMLHRKGGISDVRYPFRRVELSSKDEAQLVRGLSSAWFINPTIPSLLSLKQALSIRLLNIRSLASSESRRDDIGRGARLADIPFLHIHFVDAASIAVENFNDLINDEGGRWALMFDELELAPGWIQDELIKSLRSTEPNFLYKLAMSPHSYSARLLQTISSHKDGQHSIHAMTGKEAAADQDFEQIALWYVEKHEAYDFCYSLWYSMLEERGFPAKDPKKVLGRSYFESYYDEWADKGTAYAPDSKISNRFVSLAENDSTFRRYLSEKGIDPLRLHEAPKGLMDSVIRKIAPIVAIREYYRAAEKVRERNITVRTRKRDRIYAGAESLFAISEGNPRWFIAIVGRLLDDWQQQAKMISPEEQGLEMRKAAQRFAAMLRTIPSPPTQTLVSQRGVLSLIQTIAKYFHKKAVLQDFIAEPPSTFSVDPNTNEDILVMLQQALNAGAIVYVPEDDSELILSSLKSKRFRISYLLAPLYGLPIRLGVQISLGAILKDSQKNRQASSELPFSGGDDDDQNPES